MQNISTAMSGDANYLHLQEIPVKKIRADVACFRSVRSACFFANGMTLQFAFETDVDMRTICATISQYTL